jgi:cytochrome c biogenesis protein CcmG, thiol:disulfide interchange protein DsbE
LLAGCYGGTRPPRIGAPAPDFTLQDSDHKVSLSDYRGKVVLLNFWATWCPPCIIEMPSLIALQQKMKDKDVVILGVSIDEDEAAYHKFLKNYGVNFVTVLDKDRKTPTLYGTFGWPETYIIDRQGVVRRKFIGAAEWTSPEIVEFIGKM